MSKEEGNERWGDDDGETGVFSGYPETDRCLSSAFVVSDVHCEKGVRGVEWGTPKRDQ